MSQEGIIKYLKEKKSARAKEIAEALHLSRQAIMASLLRLSKAMEVEKEKVEGNKKNTYIWKLKNGKKISA